MFKIASYAFILLSVVSLSSCQVIETTLVSGGNGHYHNCDSDLGEYALPYSEVTLKILRTYDTTTNTAIGNYYMAKPGVKRFPDSDFKFCLGFKESKFADDSIDVFWSNDKASTSSIDINGANGRSSLLSLIVSKNIDKTGEVIRKIIRALFVIKSGNPSFADGRSLSPNQEVRVEKDEDIDVFNTERMRDLNNEARDFGFCFTLAAEMNGKLVSYTHSHELNDQEYCNDPAWAEKMKPSPYLKQAKSQTYLGKKPRTGIFYRPRQRFLLMVYHRKDPQLKRPWQLKRIFPIYLENISPIVSVSVRRAAFTTRRTALAFDNGVLHDVCVVKGSQFLGAVQIPLDIIYGLVSLPSQTIVAELNEATKRSELIAAQNRLIAAQNAYIDYVVSGGTSERPTSIGSGGAIASDLSFDLTGSSNEFVFANPSNALNEGKFASEFCQVAKGP